MSFNFSSFDRNDSVNATASDQSRLQNSFLSSLPTREHDWKAIMPANHSSSAKYLADLRIVGDNDSHRHPANRACEAHNNNLLREDKMTGPSHEDLAYIQRRDSMNGHNNAFLDKYQHLDNMLVAPGHRQELPKDAVCPAPSNKHGWIEPPLTKHTSEVPANLVDNPPPLSEKHSRTDALFNQLVPNKQLLSNEQKEHLTSLIGGISNSLGKTPQEIEPGINPRLGCALMASHALHLADPSFPETNNSATFKQALKEHGYQEITIKPGDPAIAASQTGDVLIGRRPDGMPSHVAISIGSGAVFNNNSDAGRAQIDKVDQFNLGLHDRNGNWQKNGFDDVTIYRKIVNVSTPGMNTI